MKLGTKLILYLMTTVVITMLVHGYLSLQQDQENIVREMRVGMVGLSRSIQAALGYIYGDERDVRATKTFIDGVGRLGNIHGIIVYDLSGHQVAQSVSLTRSKEYPNLDPGPVLKINPQNVLQNGRELDGIIESSALPVYFRISPILNHSGQLAGAFVLARRGLGFEQILATRRNRIIVTTSILIGLLSLLILYFVRQKVARPIEGLIERIRAIGEGRWDERIAIKEKSEISTLASEFNRMCERLQELYGRLIKEQQERVNLERNLRQSDKLASVGQFAAGLAHEIGTPLNIIGGRAEFLLRRPRSAEEISDNLEIIRSQIDRIAGIVRQLLEISRRREPAFRSVEITPLLTTVTGLLAHKIVEKKITVDIKIPQSLPAIKADTHQLQQVFINLFLNSLHALQPGGVIKIAADVADGHAVNGHGDDRRAQLRLDFEDNGAGIPPEHLDQVFDPFFTTKDVGEGTGLGLSVSYAIIKDHEGQIRVDSKFGQYTRFTILLPIDANHAGSSQEVMN
ncbi:MAG TPA: ATP-binding protein [Acidobacteriota bacterium]|nr:ATP-binding protein [Acidobacteriota bacterium]